MVNKSNPIPGSPHKDDQYGICDLSIVPVRLEPSDKSELGTQLLFGDVFQVESISEDKKWMKIIIASDNYAGWIDVKQYKPVSKEYFDLIITYDSPLCKDLIGLLQGENKFFPILKGSVLPFYKNGHITLDNEVYKFQGEIIYPKRNNDVKFLELTARNYLGAPYLWGGKVNFGIDCSGFVQQTFRFCGFRLPRDAYQQAECGIKVNFSEIKAGDLAFFSNDAGKIYHVGIIMSSGQIIHASGEVRMDNLDNKGIFHSEKKVYTHKLAFVKRLLINYPINN
jgi:gamma-D-glutamyl-L-lysine dipeptidyl-peptidase